MTPRGGSQGSVWRWGVREGTAYVRAEVHQPTLIEHLRCAGHALSTHRCSSNPDDGPWTGAVVLAVSRRGKTEAQDGEGLAATCSAASERQTLDLAAACLLHLLYRRSPTLAEKSR